MSYAIEVHNLWKGYVVGVRGCSARISVLRGVAFRVVEGERLGIVGAAGAGKTTLLHCVAGLRRPDSGVVRLSGAAAATMLLLDEASLDRAPPTDPEPVAALLFARDLSRLRGRVDRVLELRQGHLMPLGVTCGPAVATRQVAEPCIARAAAALHPLTARHTDA